jgi:general secretion pathway protein G
MKINPKYPKKSGFTLIEVLAVITIIVILAGMVIGGMGYVYVKQANSKAKVQIALLSKAIEDYKLDMGKYPGKSKDIIDTKDVTEQLYDQLFYQGWLFLDTGVATPDQPTKIYLADLDPRITKQGWIKLTKKSTSGADEKPPIPSKTNTLITDPWGKEYHYRQGSGAVNPDFDLWSAGKDGLTNKGTGAAAMKDPLVRDDVKNF